MAESPEKGIPKKPDGQDRVSPRPPAQGNANLSNEAQKGFQSGAKPPQTPNTADKHLPNLQIDNAGAKGAQNAQSAANKQYASPPARAPQPGGATAPPPARPPQAQNAAAASPPPRGPQPTAPAPAPQKAAQASPQPPQPSNPSQGRSK